MENKQNIRNYNKNNVMKLMIENSFSEDKSSEYEFSDIDNTEESLVKLGDTMLWEKVKAKTKNENNENNENKSSILQDNLDIDVGENIPYKFFSRFLDDELLNHIVEQTKKYIEYKTIQKIKKKNENPNININLEDDLDIENNKINLNEEINRKKSKVTKEKIEKYIAIILLMGIVKVPNSRMYWNESDLFGNTYFKRIMSGKQFRFINEFIHFNDNKQQNISKDKLFKISPIIDYLNIKWFENMPENYNKMYSIDESMIAYRGRLKMLQYIPSKPTKYGIKVYCLSHSESSYVQRWHIYTGRAYGGLKPSEVVSTFLEHCQPNSHLFFDSLFSSSKLFQELIHKNFFFTGSLSKGRSGFPNKPKNNEIGNHESLFSQCGSMTHVFWKNKKKILSLCSNYYDNTTVEVNSKRGIEYFQKPEMIYKYNLFSRGVDRHNQLCSYYLSNRRSIKWYRKIFFYVIEASLVNSYIFYKTKNIQKTDLMNFQLSVIQGLTKVPLNFEKEFQKDNPCIKEHRLQGKHFIEVSKSRLDCVVCSKKNCRKKTNNRCEICKVHLHETKCFKFYHTKVNYKLAFENES